MKKEIEKIADKLVYAYKKNKLINPIPIKFTKNIENATKLPISDYCISFF